MPDVPPPDAPLIPIVLGVVGHRDLAAADLPALRTAVDAVYAEFDDAYPHSPKVVFSSLAAGADQLAANVALARGPHWSVRAPLPMPPAHYADSSSFRFERLKAADNPDGTDAGSLAEFEDLIGHERVDWFVVPLPDRVPLGDGTADRTGDGWVYRAAGQPDRALDWRAVATAASAADPVAARLRSACYANAGGYVVRHCHTLVALWDGRLPERPSGTAEVVRFQLGGLAPPHYPWTAAVPLGFDGDRGPVIQVGTPQPPRPHAAEPAEPVAAGERRVLVPSAAAGMWFGERVAVPKVARPVTRGERFLARWRSAGGGEPDPGPLPADDVPRPGPWHPVPMRTAAAEYDQFLGICQTIDDFNADAAAAVRRPRPKLVKELGRVEAEVAAVFPDAAASVADGHKRPLRDVCRGFLRVRVMASHLSGVLSDWFSAAGVLLVAFLFLAVMTYHVYAHPPWWFGHHAEAGHPWPLLAAFLGFWAVMMGVVAWLWVRRLDDRRHDYRTLAEALRVRQVFAAAGLGRSVADAYLGQVRSEVAWVRRALQHLCPPPQFWAAQFERDAPDRRAGRLEWVRDKWVRGQAKWFEDKSHPLHRKAGWLRSVGFRLSLLGLAVLAAPLLVGVACEVVGPPHGEGGAWGWVCERLHPAHPQNLGLLAGTALLVGGGAFVAYCERRGYEQIAKQYDRMYVLFRSGQRELADVFDPAGGPPDVARAQRVVEALGQEAVHENAQWLLLVRSKPLELPLGG